MRPLPTLSTLVMLLLATALPACGTRGPLTLPPPHRAAAAPAAPAKPVAAADQPAPARPAANNVNTETSQ